MNAPMYDVQNYGAMMADHVRIDAYGNALRARINPDSVVLDIGAGAGILTLLACQAGARRVYAVEPDAAIQVAREAVAKNGYSGRVVFIQDVSTAIDLPEKVDVIVADIHGALPFFFGGMASIMDAKERFLKPGGSVIPLRDTVYAAIATASQRHRNIVGPWEVRGGLDLSAGRERAVNQWKTWRAPADSLVVDPQPWTTVDYGALSSPNGKGHVSWKISNDSEAHGLCLWFDCEAAPGYRFSNAPGAGPERVYGQSFFPWPEACTLRPGDEVAVEIRADAVGEDYVWSWNTGIRGSDGGLQKQFRQSTFFGSPVSREWLRKSGGTFVPSPNREALIDKTILDLFFAGARVDAAAAEIAKKFPDRFPNFQKALTRVGEMSLRYSE